MEPSDVSEVRAVLSALKKLVRSRKVAYAELARALRVSEQTVKRLFSSDRDAPLSRIIGICNYLGVSFAELAEVAREGSEGEYRLSEAQEEFLADDPPLFALYMLLRSGKSLTEIASRHAVSEKTLFRAARALERAKLIELGARGAVRLPDRGRFSWRMKGPLQKRFILKHDVHFVEQLIRRIIDQGPGPGFLVQSCGYSASIATRDQFISDLKSLSDTYQRRCDRDRMVIPEAQRVPIKWVFCLGEDPLPFELWIQNLVQPTLSRSRDG